MARKDGTPRVTPNLASALRVSLDKPRTGRMSVSFPDPEQHKRDRRDATIVLETDKVRVTVFHADGERRVAVVVTDPDGVLALNPDETSELAQAMLDAQEETRR